MTMYPSARDQSTSDNIRKSRSAAHAGPFARWRFSTLAPKAALLSTLLAAATAAPTAHATEQPGGSSSTNKPSASARPAKPSKTTTSTTLAAATAPMNDTVVPAASNEQVTAATYVYLGEYECDFKQVVQITASQRYPAYLDLRFGKSVYLMKPVVSPTGAIRLEDVRGEALLVQIARKSMLLNTKTGSRMVDECVSATQRSLIEAARSTAVEVAMPSKSMMK
jgi:hypothetical protein